MRLVSLPEAWVAPPGLREMRELVRYRMKLVQLRSGLKAQVHAVMAKEGVLPERTNMFGPGGQAQLDEVQLGDAYRIRIDSLRDLIDSFDEEGGSGGADPRRVERPLGLPGHLGDRRCGSHVRGHLRR